MAESSSNRKDDAKQQSQLTTIPNESAAPDVGNQPVHHKKITNWAGDKELCKKVMDSARAFYNKFKNQEERDDLEDGMRDADKMYRVSRKRLEGKAKNQTHNDTSDTGYFRRIRTVTAGEISVFFNGEDVPARYEIEESAIPDEYTADQGEVLAKQQNLLEIHTFEMDDREEKTNNTLTFLNKYGNGVGSIEWERIVEEKMERVVTGKDADGVPNKWAFQMKKRVIKDCPTLIQKDMRNFYMDLTIDDVQMQQCTLDRDQVVIDEIWSKQKSGEYMNAGKVGRSELYIGEGESEVLEDRKANAGDDGSLEQENGLLDRWNIWIRSPINDEGKWDPEKTLPRWCWVTFIGNIETGVGVCTRIIKNPYFHGKNPNKWFHSHRDDKGAVHMGYLNLGRDLNAQATKNLQQAFDNVDLRTRAPSVLIGHSRTRDLTFRSNKVIRLSGGSTLTPVVVPDATQITMQMHDRLEDLQDKTFGTDKTITGEALGSRTSASEFKNARDQSQKPPIEKAKYFANQYFTWMLEMDMELWRQFGDPERQMVILGEAVQPTQLWGPLKIKISSILEFESSTLVRQQYSAFIATSYPLAVTEMTPAGRKIFWSNTWKAMNLPDGPIIFGSIDIGDALKVARDETMRILFDEEDIQPEQDENFEVHLAVHKGIRESMKLAVKSGEPRADKAGLQRLEDHILRTEQLQEQRTADAAQTAIQGPGAQTEGQASGNLIAAEEGAVANV